MRFFQGFLVFGVLLLLSLQAWAAIAAADAVSFVETENNFLKKNEQLETPIVPITHDGKKYWMVPLLSGEGIATYFPVSYADKTLSTNVAVNGQLFSTAQFLRDYLTYRNKLAQQNKSFFVGRDNQLIIEKLSDALQSEVYELNIIKTELKGVSEQALITEMQSSLNRMATISSDLSQKIGTAVEAESHFTNEPDSRNLSSIRDSFTDAFARLFSLEEEARGYDDKVLRLKGMISTSSLSSDKKSQFVALANAPPDMKTIGSNSIGNWVIVSQETQAKIEQVLTASKSKVFLDAAQQELDKRIKRNKAYSEIFSPDPDFSKKTGSPSLKMAMDDLQSPDKNPLWKNQQQLGVAIEQFNTAARMLNAEEFDLSLVASQKAKRAVELVKKDGLEEPKTEEFDPTILVNIAIVALLLLIVVYFLKNRQKIVGAVVSEPEPTEVDIYGWKKK